MILNNRFFNFKGAGYQDYGGEEEDKNDGQNALNLQWVLGFNKNIDCGMHNLSTDTRTEIFYSAAHTGIIYNY